MILGRIICRFKGHKRGRRIVDGDRIALASATPTGLEGTAAFECPRCGAQWTRKVSQRKSKRKGATDGQAA